MKKILIADDDKTIVDILSSALEAEDRAIRKAYASSSAGSERSGLPAVSR
jgi:CheY-like chemotaxis protein